MQICLYQVGLKIQGKNGIIKVTQQTGYPWRGNVIFTIDPDKKTKFTLQIRVPGWLRNETLPGNLYSYVDNYAATPTVRINGKEEKATVAKGYITITRDWYER